MMEWIRPIVFILAGLLAGTIGEKVMQEIAPELKESEPYIRFHTFNDFSIDFTLYMRVSEYFDQRIGKHLFVKKLHKRYQQAGIQIPFPIREVYNMQDNP